MKKKTTEEFIEEAKNIHKNECNESIYDYSEFEYKSTHIKGKIKCEKHGIFLQSPANHLKGQGCPECYKENKIIWNQETFLKKCYELYGDSYLYENDYVDYNTKIKIYCKKHKEFFYKTPFKHINEKQGCPKCGFNTYTIEEFIKEGEIIHGKGKFDYKNSIIINNSTPIEIICHEKDFNGNEHGSFFVKPIYHINRKFGCPKCRVGCSLTKEEFIFNSNKKHDINEYSYDLATYINTITPVKILCNKCNEVFEQTPDKHMSGQGCPKCSKLFPKSEKELIEFLETLNIKNIKSHYKLKNKQELDIYLPDYNIGFEYNGDYWHSDLQKPKNYHYDKVTNAQNEGIRCIMIWEYEWVNKQEEIKSYIKAQLGLCEKRIYARKCEVREITYNDCKELLNYHQQGVTNAKKYIGLYYNDKLMLCMLLSKPRLTKKAEWEIVREICREGYSIVGGKSKVFKYFINKYKPESIMSFVDRAKFTGKSYELMGFELNHIVSARYDWVFENHTFKKRQPKIYKEMKELYTKGKIYRVWDAGRYCFIWNKND